MSVDDLTVAPDVLIRHHRHRVQDSNRRRLRKHNAESQPGNLIPSASLVYSHIGAPHRVPHVAVLGTEEAQEHMSRYLTGTTTLSIFSADGDEELIPYGVPGMIL